MHIPADTDALGQSTPPTPPEQRADQPTDNAAVSQAAGVTAPKAKQPRRSPEQVVYEQQKAKRERAEKAEAAALVGWKESQRKVKLIAGYKTIGGILERAEKGSRESIISSVQILASVEENQVLEAYLEALAAAPPPAITKQKN